MTEPLLRFEMDAEELMRAHPPVLEHPNKRVVFEIACPPGAPARGRLSMSRWAPMALPEGIPDAAGAVVVRPGVFDYEPFDRAGRAVEWHLNFADPYLFCAYGGPLLAQDELQVAEHPALASLREALVARGIEPRTVEDGEPTPILVAGVERRCAIDTAPDPRAGRPEGLYGNRFAAAPPDVVAGAVRRLEPPTITNVLAVSAPAGGLGAYAHEEIEAVLLTAHTGFRAAVLESARLAGAPRPVVVHTGFWGCGAFGGNRTLMTMLQALAARLAGLQTLVFHAFDEAGVAVAEDALARLEAEVVARAENVAQAVTCLEAMGFEWGESDGN